MTVMKTIISGAALLGMAMTALPAMASDVVRDSELCHQTELSNSNLDLREAMGHCQKSVAGLVELAGASADSLSTDEMDLLVDTAGTSAMMWAVLEYKEAGNRVTAEMCETVGIANSLYDLLSGSKGNASKEDSGANMMTQECNSKGYAT